MKSAPGHNSVKQTSFPGIANVQLHPGPSLPTGNPSASNVTQKTSDVSPSTPTNPTLNVSASITKGDTSTFDTTHDVSSTTIRNPAPNDQPASANNGDTTTSNGSNVNPTTSRNPAMFASANNGDTSIPSPQGSTVSVDSIREKNSTKSYSKSDFVGPMLDPAEVLPANKEAGNVDTGSPTFKRPIPQKGPPPKELPVSFPSVLSRKFISVNQPGESPNNEQAEQAESLFKSVPPQQDDPNTAAIITSKLSGLPSRNQPTDSPPQTERGLALSGRQSNSLPVELNSRRVPNQPAARPGTSSPEEQALNGGVNQASPLSLLPPPEQTCVAPVQATRGHHNNGPETQFSTVSGVRNPVPGGGFHFTEHEALRAGRDQSRDACIAQKLEGASESAANIPHDLQTEGPKATATTSEEPNNDTLACVSEPQQAVGNNQSPSNYTPQEASQLDDSQDVPGTNDSSFVDTSTFQNATLSPDSTSPLNSATGSADNVASGLTSQELTAESSIPHYSQSEEPHAAINTLEELNNYRNLPNLAGESEPQQTIGDNPNTFLEAFEPASNLSSSKNNFQNEGPEAITTPSKEPNSLVISSVGGSDERAISSSAGKSEPQQTIGDKPALSLNVLVTFGHTVKDSICIALPWPLPISIHSLLSRAGICYSRGSNIMPNSQAKLCCVW